MTSRAEFRILIVDDDPTIVRLLTAVLTNEGFPTPAHVATGGEAFAASEDADLVLLDHDLPDLKGTEILERLSRHPDPPSIILVTAHGDESVAATALRHGAEDYLVKDPALFKLVPQVVERVRRNQALHDALAAAERDLLLLERRAALDEMTVTLHHEINNPLMSAMAEVELLLEDAAGREGADGGDRKAALSEVLTSLERIRDIVNRARQLETGDTVEYLEGVRMVDLGALSTAPALGLGPALTYIPNEALNRVVSLLLGRAGYEVTRCPTVPDMASRAVALGIRLVVMWTSSTPGSEPFSGFRPAADRGYKLVALVTDDGGAAFAAGADHVIRLPFDPATFGEEISTIMQF